MAEKISARDIVSSFIADLSTRKDGDDSALEAILLEHVLLQAGFKIVSREPDERLLMAGIQATTPDEIWRELWDGAGSLSSDDDDYTPA
jgi:hypothetical protein